MKAGRLAGLLLVITGAAGVTVFLASASRGMRDVMLTDGGTCASGGPYAVAQQCSAADVRLLMSGILGGLVAAAIYAAGSSAMGSPASAAGLISWTALFGLLGWNFIDIGRHPTTPGSGSGWLFTGGLFWLMAAGGLIVLLARMVADVKDAIRPGPALPSVQPLVRAAVAPGMAQAGFWGYAPSAPEPQRPAAALRRAGIWLAASLAGAGLGIALSSTVVTMLR